ncbi:DinB family protein [Neobacillus notoginsengisoli]|uniref:DinB family protein n=1 Tax=Neobacillus notoginsengisoli TaxID=1578198 RepID=A0A417YQ56_9BACI|nr:DinB family protein [Neobacillus notoginsengisoli]RHW35693.1 DinB family protein [Neobacillus notoginsengisoli]
MYKRPAQGEYAAYYEPYVDLVPEGDIVQLLERQAEETRILLKGLSEAQTLFRYGEKKWSIKEVLGHMADTERVMVYRLLVIARGDTVQLPGFEENAYVLTADFDRIPLVDLLANFVAVRLATIQLVKTLPEDAWTREGIANDQRVSVRAIIAIIAGHELHHRKILMERYLGSNGFPTE